MRVAVLGGGLQGACVAMELASAGICVDLYEKGDRCLTQASAQNEGKIHLGYVYANDRTLNTARTMVRGALRFAPLLRRWLGREVDAIPVSAPFHYVVHAGSLLSVEEVENHFRQAHAIALEAGGGAPPDYFGADYRVPPARLSARECEVLFDRRAAAAAFRTPEIGIDPEALAVLVRRPRPRCGGRSWTASLKLSRPSPPSPLPPLKLAVSKGASSSPGGRQTLLTARAPSTRGMRSARSRGAVITRWIPAN